VRVLHIIEALGPGGAERLLYTNLSRLDRSRFDGVVCHLYDARLHWRQPLLDLGYPVVSLGMRDFFDVRTGLLRLSRLMRQTKVNLIHTHLYGANLYGRIVGRLHRIPVVSSLHNPDYEPEVLQDAQRLTPAKVAMMRWLDRMSHRLARPSYVAVSRHIKTSAVQRLGIDPERIEVIYNAVDLEQFRPSEARALQLRERLDIGKDDPVLLCVGRLDPQKGQRYAIRALPQVLACHPGTALLLVGGGPPEVEDGLRREAEREGVAGSVRFLGVRSDVAALLSESDVFVFPSLYEGLGIALVEAMAMGRACVASRVGPIPEIVEDGHSGLLVPPRDPNQLAAAVSRLLGDPTLRLTMGAEGRRIVEERFNIDRNIVQIEQLYDRLGRRTPRGKDGSW